MIKVTYVDHMGSDLSVVNAARVSFGKKSAWECHDSQTIRLSERDTKLIKYLASHKHISPFGHAFASFHVKAPVFVARQLVKHKFLRWNEVSKRYVDDTPKLYEPEWRSRSADKKQGSGGPVEISLESEMLFHAACRNALTAYESMINEGISPEQARSILPQNMMTEWIWSGSLDAFSDMCRLRCKEDTQAETQEVAWAINLAMEDLFPVSWVALMDE